MEPKTETETPKQPILYILLDNDVDDESTMYVIYRALDINCASLEQIEVK